MKEIIVQEIQKHYPEFPSSELENGLKHFELKTYKAKEVVLQAGEVCDYLYFPKSSISRCYYMDQEGKEETLWMKPEQNFITEYKGFTSREPSRFSLQFYEATECYQIHRDQLLTLYQESNHWGYFGVRLTEALHVTLIDVFVNLLANDATDNYRYIEYAFPRFIQVAPLKDIASMLQMSTVSLSRIRAGKQTKN